MVLKVPYEKMNGNFFADSLESILILVFQSADVKKRSSPVSHG